MHIMTEDGWQPLAVFCTNDNQLQGVYRPVSLEAAQTVTRIHAEAFCRALSAGSDELRSFSGMPLFGAFGERL